MSSSKTKAEENKAEETKAEESKDTTAEENKTETKDSTTKETKDEEIKGTADSIAEPARKPTARTLKTKDDVERVVSPIYHRDWEPAPAEPTEKEAAVFQRYQDKLKAKKERARG